MSSLPKESHAAKGQQTKLAGDTAGDQNDEQERPREKEAQIERWDLGFSPAVAHVPCTFCI